MKKKTLEELFTELEIVVYKKRIRENFLRSFLGVLDQEIKIMDLKVVERWKCRNQRDTG